MEGERKRVMSELFSHKYTVRTHVQTYTHTCITISHVLPHVPHIDVPHVPHIDVPHVPHINVPHVPHIDVPQINVCTDNVPCVQNTLPNIHCLNQHPIRGLLHRGDLLGSQVHARAV